ncbi:hypothetical protein GCM10012288_24460 [Malaciobacter pacificus]|jgi:hemerythrin superfamily protein|uniref:Uncharacterized protein n=1 Tax=Malaciobacter pacificus TaxID=1080223 RepID=A0A5C2HBV5_9BACT|nr:hypothetical protein [Malaciobacter pacificus]QEP34686.1 hypothetical protein APAC_1586 [Malaciobacter pacificus]GGD49481.1 hypothetical protein GCM10012288_24460 [Malaciobacter pacificus]
MSYLDICIVGWNLNAFMFVVNFLIAIKSISGVNRENLMEESQVLKELKEELEKYYPYRTQSTIISYIVPFTAFLRMSFRLLEMFFFFQKNTQARMFDYMVYKYTNEINKAKNRVS